MMRRKAILLLSLMLWGLGCPANQEITAPRDSIVSLYDFSVAIDGEPVRVRQSTAPRLIQHLSAECREIEAAVLSSPAWHSEMTAGIALPIAGTPTVGASYLVSTDAEGVIAWWDAEDGSGSRLTLKGGTVTITGFDPSQIAFEVSGACLETCETNGVCSGTCAPVGNAEVVVSASAPDAPTRCVLYGTTESPVPCFPAANPVDCGCYSIPADGAEPVFDEEACPEDVDL